MNSQIAANKLYIGTETGYCVRNVVLYYFICRLSRKLQRKELNQLTSELY